jgi:cation diffusion facilitator CzcD-associated flavoprotein CzcO
MNSTHDDDNDATDSARSDTERTRAGVEVDILIIGAGIVGIYQLYRALEAGFSVHLIEAGDGLGGTWYWNRYPAARFDSESYTYGYLFSDELFNEWDWSEHFAGQPEIERYLNHVVDRFHLRQHMTFGKRVTSTALNEATNTWTVTSADGTSIDAQYVVAATGVLSVPYFPDVPGREDFEGESYHTGLWPSHEVDFAGKRVAIIGTGSSGVQLVPVVADEAASLTVYQRTPNWCTPLNNAPITPDEQAELKAGFASMREALEASPLGFLHQPYDRSTFDDSKAERWEFFEKMWKTPGFGKLISNYNDAIVTPEASAEWSEFVAEKIRSIVDDPAIADRLIPKDHLFGQKRPPFVAGYFEAFNNPRVSLVSLTETPIERITTTGIQTADGLAEFDMIVWATGFDFGTGALSRMGITGRGGRALTEHWKDGATTFLGIASAGFPNLFYPGGPHGGAGNNPRYAGDQVDFITNMLVFARDHGVHAIEVASAAEEKWSAMVDRVAAKTFFGSKSYYYGSNIPGKPRRYLLNAAGRGKLQQLMSEAVATGYESFHLTR